MLEPRTRWNCTTPGCCVFVGGTAQFDIYMTNCNNHPYDPGVMLLNNEVKYEWDNRAEMDAQIDEWGRADPCTCLTTLDCTCPKGRLPEDELLTLTTAQTFVHTFFPSPVLVAMNKIRNGEEL